MDRTQQVLATLKPVVKQMGFSQKELKGIAAQLADNLNLADDASDEDVNAGIKKSIDAVVPFLKFGQSQANRLLEEWKKDHPEQNTEEPDEEGDNDKKNPPSDKRQKPTQKKEETEMPEWAKTLTETLKVLSGDVSAIKQERTSNSRKAQLEAALKDTGSYGKRTLKAFSRMKFDSDEDFDTYLEEINEDVKTWKQEQADLGLSKMGRVPGAGSGSGKEQTMTDKEIEDLAAMM